MTAVTHAAPSTRAAHEATGLNHAVHEDFGAVAAVVRVAEAEAEGVGELVQSRLEGVDSGQGARISRRPGSDLRQEVVTL